MFKLKIRTKILIIVLGLPVVALLLFNLLSFFTLHQLGSSSVSNINFLGETAANESADALRQHAREHLIRTAVDQAAISDTLFQKVEAAAEILAWYTAKTWNNPKKVVYRPSYEWHNKPKNKKAVSVIRIAPRASRKKVKRDIYLSSNLDDLFQQVLSCDQNIKSVYLGTQRGLHRRAPFTAKRKKSYDPRKRDWYKQAVKTKKTGWTDLYISASEEILMVTCYKPVYTKKKRLIGVVGLDVTLASLNEKIISTHVGKKGYALLLDREGQVIAHPELTKGNQKWYEAFKTQNWLRNKNRRLRMTALEMTMGEIGVQQCHFDGSDKFIAYAPIKTTRWSIGIVMPVDEIILPAQLTRKKIISKRDRTESEIKGRFETMSWASIGFLIIMILITGMVGVRLSNTITRPILSLDKGVRIIGEGNLDHRLDVKTGDELEDLADAFNKMSDDLILYIENLKETTAAKERIESELNIAREIQLGLLQKIFPPFPDYKQFELFAMLEPAKEVGGDLYDFFFIDEDHLCFSLGDVSDKGVPAALFMTITMTLLRNNAKQYFSPQKIMSKINDALSSENPRSMFVTLIIGILNIRTGEVVYSNGGHNPPILLPKDSEPEYIRDISGPIVGPIEGIPYKKLTLNLKPGDAMFLYTDGVTEALNKKEELFSEEQLLSEVSRVGKKHVKEITKNVWAKVIQHAGGTPQSDDVAMMLVRFKGPVIKQEFIYSKSGKPYKTKKSAENALKTRDDLSPRKYGVKEISGKGWVIARK